MRNARLALIALIPLLLALGGVPAAPAGRAAPSPARLFLPALLRQADLAGAPSTPAARRRINAPSFDAAVDPGQAALLWFGRVDPTTAYADVRIAYTPTELDVYVSAIDRRLWYQSGLTAPPQTPGRDDSVTLLIDRAGGAGGAPAATSHRFEAGLSWWESSRAGYQAAFVGSGTDWRPASTAFTTEAAWRGSAPDDELDDKGWSVTYHIPFGGLGLSGAPAEGTVWGLGLQLHNRDDAAGSAIPDQLWPPGLSASSPATWGELRFGLPGYAGGAGATGSATIRQGLDGASVPDGQVGGYTTCGSLAADGDYFPRWGGLNYAGYADFNVQNEADVSDWPCFSRYYVSFPLTGVPPGKTIVSAQLTLHQFGNSGNGGPSLVQVFTVDQPWSPATLTWNNAPLARENVGQARVDALASTPPWPGVARQWDLSRAVAEAYAASRPALDLALDSADTGYNSGKYFVSSQTGDWNAAGRPTLQVSWRD